ncbi:hypothetical protein VdG1_02008 [Verticillium dahliae VDG1]|nr:hypothetical protein VdG1_02008 [Verticillium dahliae VDG1]
MPFPKKDNSAGPGRGQNGSRGGFRTDAAISNSRLGAERTLQPWMPDSTDGMDEGLESSSNKNNAPWDQFAENERRFGIKTDYDENIYTTAIDKSHPQYRERMAAAEKKAREISGSQAATAHVAEERIMDYAGGDDRGGDEEDKYSGVRRQDFPPLSTRENKYTPPAKRAPAAQSTVTGAPVDPAIISSQVRAPSKKPSPARPEDAKSQPVPGKLPTTQPADESKPVDSKAAIKSSPKGEAPKPARADSPPAAAADTAKQTEVKQADKTTTPLRAPSTSSRAKSPQTAAKEGTPSAALTVERDVLNSFKSFATQQRQNADKIRTSKAKADKEVKLTELKKFAQGFKLSTPVPTDLISIIAKDPSKQKEIQAKALQNAEDVARTKTVESASKDKDAKDVSNKSTAAASATQSTPDGRAGSRPLTSQYANSPGSGPSVRNANARQSYAPPSHHNQSYRNDRQGQHVNQQARQSLGQRLRNTEQQKMSQAPPHQQPVTPEVRVPPTGPSNSAGDSSFGRRLSGVPGHMGPKLNPNSHEFRPNPFATSFNPISSHPSAGSSPRSGAAVNTTTVDTAAGPAPAGQLIRRKTKAIDVQKCFILAHIKTFTPPKVRNWDDNEGLRPSYDTIPTWRQLQEEDEKPESTMRLTYKEFLEQQSFAAPSMTTPTPPHVTSNNAHHYQLPLHMQQNAHGTAPRQSPNMPTMPLHNQHVPAPHGAYTNGVDDHRMMHSNSAQSFASPRMSHVPITYTPAVNSPAQVPYSQPMMQPYGGPGTPQMNQYRSFSNTHQYLQQQPGHMGGPMIMQPQFMSPQGMLPGQPMQMYGGHAQFPPPNGGPPPHPGSNGYSSPGRPAAPMMAHQGSQQGQTVYGMSPSVPYQQPVFAPQQPGLQGGNARGYNNSGPQHFGTSPQQMHAYGAQHRAGNNYGSGKNLGNNGAHGHPQGHGTAANPQTRASEGPAEAK